MITKTKTTESLKAVAARGTGATADQSADETVQLVMVADAPSGDAGPEMKKQELLDKVLSRADVRKKVARPVVDAVLEVLGEALAEGREMNLPPLGRVKLNRVKDLPNARVIVAKIRQAKPGGRAGAKQRAGDAKDEVAEEAE
ncbi:HU family DNA-binding protein [Roseovarius azorensis]|nr:HU family DNA-binding protein [Roseovarius azorensis]